MIPISNVLVSTWIFTSIFVGALIIGAKRVSKNGLTITTTTELKGFAIFTIIFAHIAYLLVSNDRFLWPLSILSGVGVNLFLMMSGFGLSVSNLKQKQSIKDFYLKRLPGLFVPLWIVLTILLLLDVLILGRSYTLTYSLQSFVGIFTNAEVKTAINSPLWYFSVIFLYYLLFPLIFFKNKLWASALIVFSLGYLFVHTNMLLNSDVKHLYQIHFLAFPIGIFLAWLLRTENPVHRLLNRCAKNLNQKIAIKKILYWITIATLLASISYFAYYSGVNESTRKEQSISILLTLLIIMLFSLKKIQFKLFTLFGGLAFEIYLIHWPLISRYVPLYEHMPPWLATILFFIVTYVLAKLLQDLSKYIIHTVASRSNLK